MKKTKTAPRNRRKNIESMKREEIIEELRKHLDPIAFQKNLTESTAMLRGLLCYQRDPLKNDERIFPKVGAKHLPVKCGCGAPWAHTGKHRPELVEISREDARDLARSIGIALITAGIPELTPPEKKSLWKRIAAAIHSKRN